MRRRGVQTYEETHDEVARVERLPVNGGAADADAGAAQVADDALGLEHVLAQRLVGGAAVRVGAAAELLDLLPVVDVVGLHEVRHDVGELLCRHTTAMSAHLNPVKRKRSLTRLLKEREAQHTIDTGAPTPANAVNQQMSAVSSNVLPAAMISLATLLPYHRRLPA